MDEPNFKDRPTPPSLKPDPALAQPSSLLERLMARRRLLAGVVVLGLVAVVTSGALLWAVAGDRLASTAPTPTAPRLAPPPSLQELAQQYPELAELLNNPTLGSVYKDFIIAYESGGLDAARELAFQRGLLNDRDEIRITLVVDSAENVPTIVEEMQKAGIIVEGSYRERINVGVPLALIQQLAEQQGTEALFEQLAHMEHIIRLELPLPKRPDRVAPVQGEGVSLTGADAWHAAGFTGQSIRIGVLDLGFDGYGDILGSELPASVTAASFVYGEEPDGSGEVHGTACAEIVHEMAPDAELFLAYYDGTLVSEGQATDWLLEQEVHIISHSAGSVVGPMDGSGEDAELVDEVAGQKVLWVNSAGNEGESHYRGLFTDTDGDGLHEFPDGDEEIMLWPYAPAITIVLNWDDWADITEDYDLFLYDAQGDLVASSEDAQDGSPGQLAAEGFIINRVTDAVYYATIKAYNVTRAGTLDLYTLGADVEFPVAEHSLNTPADARGSLTVGATEYRDESLASYSSQGPTNDGRLKPEISAPAGVSGATYGADGFDGTSASAPHVAGAAALVWSAFPDFSREQVSAYLQSHALDLGPPGPDNGYGHGRLQLPAAPEPAEAAGPTLPTLPAPPTLPPFPTLIPESTAIVVPVPVELEPPEIKIGTTVPLIVLLGGLGLCGAAVALGGAVLLLVVWRRSRQRAPRVVPPPLPSLPSTRPLACGVLVGVGRAPVSLLLGATTIGRGAENDIVLDNPKISRHHARIECAKGVCTVEDLQSSNGTFVNDKRVTRAVLSPGDRLRFDDVELTFQAVEAQPSSAWLEIGGRRYPVQAGGITIGRSSDNDIHLADKLASRQHARIEMRGDVFVLTDLGSTNGTSVNGRRTQEQSLRDGDEILIGHSRLRFHTQGGA